MESLSNEGQILHEQTQQVIFSLLSQENASMKEYILSIKALEVCLSLQE